jgi:Flp pilus assembly protein TadB
MGTEAELIKIAATQGVFAALFVALLFYVLRENSKREERLMDFFEAMNEHIAILGREVSCGFTELNAKLDRVLNHVKGD